MNNKEQLKLFLKELSDLSKKHEIYISGCGCCGSPNVGNEYIGASDLEYTSDCYTVGDIVCEEEDAPWKL